MFAFPAGPAAPSRDIGEKGHPGQQLKGGKRAFSSFELQTPGCTHRPLKNGDMEGFWGVFQISLDFPRKEPPETAFLKCLCCLAPAIYLIWVHLLLPHTMCHTGISMEFKKNLLQTKRKARRLGLLPFSRFLTEQPGLTACERFHWAEKSSSCMVSKSGAINDS